MEDKEKVMGDYLCNLKFTVSKTWLEMLCHVVFIFTFHCVTKKISTHCVMSGDLSDEVLGSFRFVSFSVISARPQKAVYHQFIVKEICINKNVSRKPAIRSTGFSKPKTNYLPTVVTIFFVSNKTRYSYFMWRNCRGRLL